MQGDVVRLVTNCMQSVHEHTIDTRISNKTKKTKAAANDNLLKMSSLCSQLAIEWRWCDRHRTHVQLPTRPRQLG